MRATIAPTRLMPMQLSFAGVLALSACATLEPDRGATPLISEGKNIVFAAPLAGNLDTRTPSGLATLVFYRPGVASGSDVPMNIYVNGRFLSALLPGVYVEHSACAVPMQLAAVFDDARIRQLGKGDPEMVLSLDAGKTYFFQADANSTGTQGLLRKVEAQEVSLGQYRRQAHVLTRAPNCAAPASSAAPIAPVLVAEAAPVVAVAAPTIPVTMPATEPVYAALERWRAAWESGNYEAYKRCYAADFKGTLASRTIWEQQRSARLTHAAKSITLENLAVETTQDAVFTDFKQVYKSRPLDSIGQKRLVWKSINDELKIVEERFVSQ